MDHRHHTETVLSAECEALAAKSCIPCQGGIPALTGKKLLPLIGQLGHGWHVVHEHHLMKRFAFPDFVTALKFVNAVGEIAEQESHHPDLLLGWGKVEVSIWTHKIDGLTESDFVLAAKIEVLPRAPE